MPRQWISFLDKRYYCVATDTMDFLSGGTCGMSDLGPFPLTFTPRTIPLIPRVPVMSHWQAGEAVDGTRLVTLPIATGELREPFYH